MLFKDLNTIFDDENFYEKYFYDTEQIIIESNEDYVMLANKEAIKIPSLGIELHEGTCYRITDDGELEPDWAFTSINELGASADYYLYYEQGDFYSTLSNYLSFENLHHLDIDNLEIELPSIDTPLLYVERKHDVLQNNTK